MSINSTSPATLFGGIWEQIQGRFLLSASSSYTAGDMGGASTINLSHAHTTAGHILTVDEMPSHNHNLVRQQWYTADPVYSDMSGSIYSWKSGEGTGGNTSYSWLGTYDVKTTGGGASHSHGNTGSTLSSSQSIMPPYLVVYIQKRTG